MRAEKIKKMKEEGGRGELVDVSHVGAIGGSGWLVALGGNG